MLIRRGGTIALVLSSILLLSMRSFAETVIYEYDDLNRLILVTHDNGTSIEYTYDEVGNREEKIITTTILDSDGDGIPDDGDGSGDGTDNPCTGGVTAHCDDNCQMVHNPLQEDFDDDLVGDVCDNCRERENTDQRDTNNPDDDNPAIDGVQHYGNACDPDFNNNGAVDIIDLNLWRAHSGSTVPPADPDLDTNGDGVIWLQDLATWRLYYGNPPGPGIGD